MRTSLAHRPQYAAAPIGPVPDAFDRLPEAKRQQALSRLHMIQRGLDKMALNVSAKEVALWLERTGPEGMPAAKTLEAWIGRFRRYGVAGLADHRLGRARRAYGWEARAQYHFTQPQRPCVATVARWLKEEGFDSASASRVRCFIKSLPATQSTLAPNRVGRHYHDQNVKPYVIRDASVLPVGFVYQGDGHTCDAYVLHPNSNGHYRPELTFWIDVRSQFIVSWWLSESESAITTMYSFSAALVDHDNVPAFWHVDPGSGFIAKMNTDETTGLLARFGIQRMEARPGNAKGKGLVERLFGIFEERTGKRFASYCGHCRTDDALNRLEMRIKRGEIEPPTFAQYADAVRHFVTTWNSENHKGLAQGETPEQLWQQMDRVPVETPAAAVIRPAKRCKVRRSTVTLDGRAYRHPALAQWDGEWVMVEYSLTSDQVITVRDLDGRYLTDATLTKASPWMPTSRIKQAQQKRLKHQQKRLQNRMDELSARANEAIPGQIVTPLAADFARVLPAQKEEADGLPPIDLYDTSYSDE